MFEQDLSKLMQDHLYRELTIVDRLSGPYVSIRGKKILLLCSNDYLGLANDPALAEAAARCLALQGFGAGASRLVSGTTSLHRELEDKIALFKGTDAALLFNSGYAANTGVIPALAGPGDVILSDRLNHASIVDGCRLSRAEVLVYRHSDPDHVEALLKKSSAARRKLIVTDGVFSMDGDVASLPELVTLAEQYGAILMVDDAHGTGVLGKTGRGVAEYYGLSRRVPVQMGTLSKALGSFGAYVAGDKDLVSYLINKSRSFIFSTALPPSVCAASIAALEIADNGHDLREKLMKNRERFISGLASLGVNIGPTATPIIPVMLGDAERTLAASKKLLEYGVFAAAIRPPAVLPNAARIRTTVTAAHSEEDIDRAVEAFRRLRREGYL